MYLSTKKFIFYLLLLPLLPLTIFSVFFGVVSGALGGSFFAGAVSVFIGVFLSLHPVGWVLKGIFLLWFVVLYLFYRIDRKNEILSDPGNHSVISDDIIYRLFSCCVLPVVGAFRKYIVKYWRPFLFMVLGGVIDILGCLYYIPIAPYFGKAIFVGGVVDVICIARYGGIEKSGDYIRE